MTTNRDLLFVSTRFLFPVDSGGKIRTTQILRGLKGGRFRIVLASPANPKLIEMHREDLDSVCDEFQWWPQPDRGEFYYYARMGHIVDPLPIPVRTDRHPASKELVVSLLAGRPAVAVFDFAHADVLAPEAFGCPSVIFTHNVEAEIFRRHVEVVSNPVSRLIWKNQYKKMLRFERSALKKYDVVVAVADRDRNQFLNEYSISNCRVIPTGVDLEFFEFRKPVRDRDVVFCGSMDWMANQESMQFFMNEVWEKIADAVPDARMTVVGRSPPENLIRDAKNRRLNWNFTGFVDDVRPFVQGAAVSVIPLRVGGGTRLKAYEAMAMGSPIVSTAIGMEGLPAIPDQHYVLANEPQAFADKVCVLLKDAERRHALALDARKFVRENFSYIVAAKAFEQACDQAISHYGSESVNND